MRFVAPCLLGLESMVANELRFAGIEKVSAENGRVLFEGGPDAMARANICSRFAQRVLILLAEFEARDFEKDAFPVKGSCVSSTLSSVPACQKIVKKAIVESLQSRYRTEWFEETGETFRIQFLIFKNRVSIMLDTSGEPLNKRGWRAQANDAPIRETLAAAMAELSRVRSGHTVVDPFCGSGTILIESARRALNILPGIDRSFAFEEWREADPAILSSMREQARDEERRDAAFTAYGYDIDEQALELAAHNAALAGVGDRIVFERRDIRDYRDEHERVTVITNPPYGERLLDTEQAQELARVMGRAFVRKPYQVMGEKFVQKPYHSYTVISPDDSFEQLFGRPADKRRKLYNGTLRCQVYQYYK